MDIERKLWWLFVAVICTISAVGVVGCSINNNRFIKEGYHQEHFEYCSDTNTRIIWVK